MDLFQLSLFLYYVMSFAMLPSSLAQDSPQDFVNAHNAARALVGVGPVKWDERVARFARQYANQLKHSCKLVHLGGPYGENLAWSGYNLSGIAAVWMWVTEKQYYNPRINTCATGKVCGHYTQVVWRKSVRIRCAKVKCTNNRGTFITCNNDPPGNVKGQRPS